MFVENASIDKMYCGRCLQNVNKWLCRSMGTLGGGNHFIEIDVDSKGNKYLIIHTGSRNLGKQVAEIYQGIAIHNLYSPDGEEIERTIQDLKAAGREKEISEAIARIKEKQRNAPPKDLCYLEGEYRDQYLHDMRLCQQFAVRNRAAIANAIAVGMRWDIRNGGFETIHNYIDDANMVRKGAISAKGGEQLLIPINMRDGCILGRGKGDPDWNCSAPHGAGRIMSRMEARERISLDDYKDAMTDIYTTSVGLDTIDEAPFAYRGIDEILECIKDTVDVEDILHPVYNFKAGE